MDIKSYRAFTLARTTCLPFALGWLLGDAEWAMGIVQNSNGHEWGEFLRCSGGLLSDAPWRLMAAFLTWRELPIPRNLQPVVERVNQLLVSQPRPYT